jgi:hypothetical protein
MGSIRDQIESADAAICGNIRALTDDRGLLSQNILAQLRNLLEGVVVRLHQRRDDTPFSYHDVGPALAFVKGNGKLNFLVQFHRLLQVTSSHYTLGTDPSERLMLKYYEYMLRLRATVYASCGGLRVLSNLELFPLDLDPALTEYHQKIAARIDTLQRVPVNREAGSRYYIHRILPFFVEGRIFYEVTLLRAVNRSSKFDRTIAFTDIDMTDKYAAYLVLHRDSIDVLGCAMPITVIRYWGVSIRPCEFNNFAKVFGILLHIRGSTAEYRYIMDTLTTTGGSLLDLIDMDDTTYGNARFFPRNRDTAPTIFSVIDAARQVVRRGLTGQNLVRYLLLRMNNEIIKAQLANGPCDLMSNLWVNVGTRAFERMPFCTSLCGHNPRIGDVLDAIDTTGREYELLSRRLQTNVEQNSMLYTPLPDLQGFGDVDGLMREFNNRLYWKHTHRRLLQDKGHAFIEGYEDDTARIIEQLQLAASQGVAGHEAAVERWLSTSTGVIDDPAKRDALAQLFSHSRVALVYGAAGTGKSTMLDHIARYFGGRSKLFLAHTNPAVDNLKRKVHAQNATFRTISSHIYRGGADPEYDLLVIDECSTVSNSDLLKVLAKTTFKLLVLVGDVYQIESIQFGNWFSIARSFLPKSAIFELRTPFRTKNPVLLSFWDKVRNVEPDIEEVIAKNGYSSALDQTLFQRVSDDEVILCLNYDGLYGINNVNRFLQASNPNPAISWREATYKVGDPVVFNETERFRPVLYNNLKGRIVAIERHAGAVQFDVEVDRPLTELDVLGTELEWVEGSTVRFSVSNDDASDEDDDALHTVVPFQVAYAVSIHKAQGLEYNSVKIVVTNANEDDLTHSIFYTAVTRTRQHLRIFWTPETQRKVLAQLGHAAHSKDVHLLAARRGLKPA